MDEFMIIFFGNSNIGAKTSLIIRITDHCFKDGYIATVGMDMFSKIINTDFGEIKMKILDTAGGERCRAITPSILKHLDCIILGYDVTDRDSFESIKYYHDSIKNNITGDLPLIYLVGNKIDLVEERKISDEEGISLANDLNMKYFGVSAKTGENVDNLLNDIVNSLINNKNNKIDKIDKFDNVKKILDQYLNF